MRAAFTLVEMLVAVGLVLLMMSLFATIFQVATGSMQTQKGIAENDQKVRLVLTILRGDLTTRSTEPTDSTKYRPYRTYKAITDPDVLARLGLTVKKLLAFEADEDMTAVTAAAGDRLGYFYIREGDGDDDTDDILQLTVTYPLAATERFWGAARYQLIDASAPNTDTYPLNQPIFDDSDGTNNASMSRMAEVAYFLRNGTLYRRVLLIREPALDIDATNDHTPEDSDRTPLQTSEYEASGTRNFYADFDFSAFYDTNGTPGPRFHGQSSLAWDATFPLSKPQYRFGHYLATGASTANHGLPREYISDGTNSYYIGRFTQQETSFTTTDTATSGITSFGYPGRIATTTAPNPYDPATTFAGMTNGVVSDYQNGQRIGEDVLLTGVTRFDIKVWDPAAGYGPDGQPGRAGVDDDGDGTNDNDWERGWPGTDDGDWVDLGRTTPTGTNRLTQSLSGNPYTSRHAYGFFGSDAVNNTYYASAGNYRFDTWNPQINIIDNSTGTTPADGANDPPPFGTAYVWQYIPNAGNPYRQAIAVRGLQAIKITITFYDPSSGQLRDVTLVQSMSE